MSKKTERSLKNEAVHLSRTSGQEGSGREAEYLDRCPYCGAMISRHVPEPPLANVHTRTFAVCGEPCRQALELYVQRDVRGKRFFYPGLMLVGALILAGSLVPNASSLLFSGVMAMGINLMLFPYPITSFETFFACPIRRVTVVCRVLGIGFFLLGLFFIAMKVAVNVD